MHKKSKVGINKEWQDGDQVLFEIRVMGASARVAAIHVRTNTEVQVVCPASYARFSMEQAAVRKLKYVLARKPTL